MRLQLQQSLEDQRIDGLEWKVGQRHELDRGGAGYDELRLQHQLLCNNKNINVRASNLCVISPCG